MNINDITSTGLKATRDGFGQGLLEAGRLNPNIVGLTADLMESLQMQHFQKEFPERFFQIGIAEANMMGIAAGLATAASLAWLQAWPWPPHGLVPGLASSSSRLGFKLDLGFPQLGGRLRLWLSRLGSRCG